MRNNIKFLLVCAILAGSGFVLTAAGALTGGMISGIQINAQGIQVHAPSLNKKDGQGSSYELKEEKLEAFQEIEIEAEYEDIRIEASDSDEYSLSYCLDSSNMIQKEIKDGRLVLKHKGSKTMGIANVNLMWFSMGRTGSGPSKEEYITIRLPRNAKLSSAVIQSDSGNAECEALQTDSLKITADYGAVSILDVQAGEIEAVLDSGDLQMQEVRGRTCSVKNEYGDVSFQDVNFTGNMKIAVDSGDIKCWNTHMGSLELASAYGGLDIQESEFENVQITMENGDARCWNTKMDSLTLESAYGELDVQDSELGAVQMSLDSGNCKMNGILFDNCKIKSAYGNVNLQMKKPVTDYRYNLKTEYGSIKIDGKQMGESYTSLEEGNEHQIEILCESGDIVIQ